MVREIRTPRMQHCHHTHQAAEIMRIGCQLDYRMCCCFDQEAIEFFLMQACKCPQLMRQRKDYMIIRYRQEFFFPRAEPCFGLVLVALRTTAVTTGVIRILQPTAVIAFEYMASQRGRTASEYVLERSAMTGWHLIAELMQVLRAVASQDVCYFDHGGCPADQSCRMISLIFFWTSAIVPWVRCI
jgi:hypothetical protein